MSDHVLPRCNRRQMLGAAGAWSLGAAFIGTRNGRVGSGFASRSGHEPAAMSGDRIEPAWDERLTITVGGKDGDLVGTTDKAIQAAVDYVAQRGGGTVHIQPGTYRFRNAVYLAPRIRLIGSGPETVLIKEPFDLDQTRRRFRLV